MDYRVSDAELATLEGNASKRGARFAQHAVSCSNPVAQCDCAVAVRYRVLVVERDVFVEGLRRIH